MRGWIPYQAIGILLLPANLLLNHAKFTNGSLNMTEEMSPQGLPTATGSAARVAIAMLRKHNIATAPLLLRAGLSEHGLARAADQGNGHPQRVSAIGQCKFLSMQRRRSRFAAGGLRRFARPNDARRTISPSGRGSHGRGRGP